MSMFGPSSKRPREHCLPMGMLETAGPKRAKLVFDGVVIRRKVSSLGPGVDSVEHQTIEEDSPATEDEDHDGSDGDSLFLYSSAEESDGGDSTLAPTRYTYDKHTHTRLIPIPKVKKVKKGYVAAVPSAAHTSCTFLGFACHHQSHIDTTTGSFPWDET